MRLPWKRLVTARTRSSTAAKEAVMHTAPEPLRDRLEARRAPATTLAERFSPDESEGSRERSVAIGIETLIANEPDSPRADRPRVHSDATAPLLTP
jgi:hypothetical protein